MKLLIASDIHGSAEYCRKLLQALDLEQADKLVLLGDILYHGPRNDLPAEYSPKEVISLLAPVADKIVCVGGNCDAEIDREVLPFAIVETAYLNVDGQDIYLAHGHRPAPRIAEGGVYVTGHTHVPVKELHAGVWYLNPGSVSIPKEDSKPSYIVYDSKTFIFKTLEGEEFDKLDLNEKPEEPAPVEEPPVEEVQTEEPETVAEEPVPVEEPAAPQPVEMPKPAHRPVLRRKIIIRRR